MYFPRDTKRLHSRFDINRVFLYYRIREHTSHSTFTTCLLFRFKTFTNIKRGYLYQKGLPVSLPPHDLSSLHLFTPLLTANPHPSPPPVLPTSLPCSIIPQPPPLIHSGVLAGRNTEPDLHTILGMFSLRFHHSLVSIWPQLSMHKQASPTLSPFALHFTSFPLPSGHKLLPTFCF